VEEEVKQTIGEKFQKRYGKEPKDRWMQSLYDMLFDTYAQGHIDGYDAANKMWKKKGGKK